MINFIVSGQVPGTHLQITFLLWQLATCGIIGYAIFRLAARFRRTPADFADDDAQTATAQTAQSA